MRDLRVTKWQNEISEPVSTARRSMLGVDCVVPGQHLLEDVLVSVFSNRNPVGSVRERRLECCTCRYWVQPHLLVRQPKSLLIRSRAEFTKLGGWRWFCEFSSCRGRSSY